MRIAAVLLTALLVSCGDRQTPEHLEATERLLARDNQIELDHPDVVGRLPDGRTLYHSTVRIKDSFYSHHVYYAGSDLTINFDGKAPQVRAAISAPQDTVIIDGKRYDVNEVKQALARDEDQRRKEKQ